MEKSWNCVFAFLWETCNSLCCMFQHKTALDTLLDWYQENEMRDSEFLAIFNNLVELLKEKTPGKG